MTLKAVVSFADQVRIAHGHTATALAFKAAFFFIGGFELQAEKLVEGLADIGQRNPVLRAFWSGQTGFYSAHVQCQGFGEYRLLTCCAPQTLGLAIGLDQFDGGFWAPGQTQVVQGDFIDWEKAAGGAIFRGHVGNGGAVGQRKIRQAITVKLHELADNALAAQHLRDGQYQVRSGDAFFEFAAEFETHHFGDQHRHGLAEHCSFSFDPAHAPA